MKVVSKIEKLDYDPYEEDVCGHHLQETLTISCADNQQIVIEESKSGVGADYKIIIMQGGKKKPVEVLFYYDDDGEYHYEASVVQ